MIEDIIKAINALRYEAKREKSAEYRRGLETAISELLYLLRKHGIEYVG